MKRTGKLSAIAMVAALAILLGNGKGRTADTPIELKFASPFPAEWAMSQADKLWIEKIERETRGRVKIKAYWTGTLVTPTAAFDEIKSGVADIGFASPDYEKSGFDLHKYSILFMHGADPAQGRRIWKEVMKRFPQIEGQYRDIVPMDWSTGYTYQYLSTKPVRKLAEFKGQRMKANPGHIPVVKSFGAEGVAMPMPEAFESLQKNALHGVIATLSDLKTARLADVTKYVTMINLYPRPMCLYIMNKKSYEKLPPDIQKIFQDSFEWLAATREKSWEDNIRAGSEFAKQSGVEFIEMSPDEAERFNEAVRREALKSAALLDSKGLPGTQIYNESQRLIKLSTKQ